MKNNKTNSFGNIMYRERIANNIKLQELADSIGKTFIVACL